MVTAEWFELGAVLRGDRPQVSIAFLALFDLFLLRMWWLEVPLFALLTNLLFVAAILVVVYTKVLPKLIGLLVERPRPASEEDSRLLLEESTIRSFSGKVEDWLGWLTSFDGRSHSTMNV